MEQGRSTASGAFALYAAAKHPHLDWRLKSKMEFSGYHQLLQRCRQHVILGRVRANSVDFVEAGGGAAGRGRRGVRRGPPIRKLREGRLLAGAKPGRLGPDRGRPDAQDVLPGLRDSR